MEWEQELPTGGNDLVAALQLPTVIVIIITIVTSLCRIVCFSIQNAGYKQTNKYTHKHTHTHDHKLTKIHVPNDSITKRVDFMK